MDASIGGSTFGAQDYTDPPTPGTDHGLLSGPDAVFLYGPAPFTGGIAAEVCTPASKQIIVCPQFPNCKARTWSWTPTLLLTNATGGVVAQKRAGPSATKPGLLCATVTG